MSGKIENRYCEFCKLQVAIGDPEQLVYLGQPVHKHCKRRAEQQRRDVQMAQEERLARERRRLTPLVVLTNHYPPKGIDINLYN